MFRRVWWLAWTQHSVIHSKAWLFTGVYSGSIQTVCTLSADNSHLHSTSSRHRVNSRDNYQQIHVAQCRLSSTTPVLLTDIYTATRVIKNGLSASLPLQRNQFQSFGCFLLLASMYFFILCLKGPAMQILYLVPLGQDVCSCTQYTHI